MNVDEALPALLEALAAQMEGRDVDEERTIEAATIYLAGVLHNQGLDVEAIGRTVDRMTNVKLSMTPEGDLNVHFEFTEVDE